MPKPVIEEDEVKGDMTPMIDIIFLLLIFFILTTKFIPDEKAISSILPTNMGQSAPSKPTEVEPPQDINVRLYPGSMVKNKQPSQYQAEWDEGLERKRAALVIGNTAPHIIDGNLLDPNVGASVEQQRAELQAVHEYIFTALQQRELAGVARKEQSPVNIHCFSGLSWKYALVAYDAVRKYEAETAGNAIDMADPVAMQDARPVTFAPPRVRNYTSNELGNELFEIIHLK